MVLDGVLLEAAVGLALPARVGPGKRRLDAVARVVGKGQADRAGRRDRQQVRVADAVRADALLQRRRQARREAPARQVQVGVEQRECAALGGQVGRGRVRRIAQDLGDAPRLRARRLAVIAQAEHDQRVAQPGEAQPDAALGLRLGLLLRQRPDGDVEHVVEHAHGHLCDLGEAGLVEARAGLEGVEHEMRQVDAAEAATAVRRQRLLSTRVGRRDRLAVAEVVVGVDAVEEQHAGLGVVVGRAHDLVPQLARAQPAVDPQAIGALPGAFGLLRRCGLGAVHELDLGVGLHGLHEGVGDADREVEILQVAAVLGVDELLDVGVVAAQHAHLRAAAAAGALDGLATAVEDAHVADRPRRRAARAADPRALGPDAREVVADATAAAHRLGRFGQRGVDARVAVVDLGDRVAHRLHEAVDQRRAQLGAGGRGDAPGRDEAALLRLQEAPLPPGALLGRLDGGQRTCDASAHFVDAALAVLGVFLDQHLGTDRLRRQRTAGAGAVDAGARVSLGHVLGWPRRRDAGRHGRQCGPSRLDFCTGTRSLRRRLGGAKPRRRSEPALGQCSTSSGSVERASTALVCEPNRNSPKAPRPWVTITIRSHWRACAVSTMAWSTSGVCS